jgi:hypothetical protein
MSSEQLELGPVDILVIGFPPDAPRTGESIPLVVDLADRGIIRILDVMLIQKEADGTIVEMEITDIGGEISAHLEVFDGASSGMLGDEDASVAGAGLEPGEAAALLCFENSWAAPFVTSVMRNGGRVLGFERIPAEDLMETLTALGAAE